MRWSWLSSLPVFWVPSPALQDVSQQAQARSAIDKAAHRRLRSAQDLARTWLQRVGEQAPKGDYDFFWNATGVPEVDFEAFEVVAIFRGQGWNSAARVHRTPTTPSTPSAGIFWRSPK